MIKKAVYFALSFAPVMALAQPLAKVDGLVVAIGKIIAKIIPIMFALAIIYFFWGIITYIKSAGDPDEAAKGKSIMIYGVIGIAVMVSIYGLVFWLQETLGIDPAKTSLPLPKIDGINQ